MDQEPEKSLLTLAGRTETEQRPAGTIAWQRSERSISNLQDEETFTWPSVTAKYKTWGSLMWRINVNPFHNNSETQTFKHTSPKTMQPPKKRVSNGNNHGSGYAGNVPAKC